MNSGISLILVLGVIAILSVLIITFSRVTRTERLSTWHEVNSIRADELARLALTRAMADTRLSEIFPLAFASTNGSEQSPEVSNHVEQLIGSDIPYAICSDARSAEATARWIPIVIDATLWPDATNSAGTLLPSSSITNGQIAYMVLNVSGFADINCIGVTNWAQNPARIASFYVNELDLGACLDITNPAIFASHRSQDRWYETMSEVLRLNQSALDPTNNALVAFSYDPPYREMYITNTGGFGTRSFTSNLVPRLYVNDPTASNWLDRITNTFAECGLTNNAYEMDCRLTDYLDTDRIPTNSQFVSEAIPLLNEVRLSEQITTDTTQYVFEVELWYPFHPPPLEVESFSLTLETTDPAANAVYTNLSAACSFTNFPCFIWTNSALTNITSGVDLQVVIFWQGIPVFRRTLTFFALGTVAWDDPRVDLRHTNTPATFGAMNSTNTALTAGSHGLPIFHRDGLMRNIGEIGYIHTGEPWRNIDLADMNQAALLDRLTVRPGTNSTRGLISATTEDPNTLDLLFYGTPFGITNTSSSASAYLTNVLDRMNAVDAYRYAITNSITLGGLSSNFLSRFNFSTMTTNFVGSDLKEDIVRGFVELVSFRHSLYYVVVSAQALASNGTPVAERNALALVWRDTYTGQYFVRWFRWME